MENDRNRLVYLVHVRECLDDYFIERLKNGIIGPVVYDDIDRALKDIPAVDAVEVVRCRECKYCHIEDEYEAWCHGGLPAVLTRATEDFCSHGKRREDGDT